MLDPPLPAAVGVHDLHRPRPGRGLHRPHVHHPATLRPRFSAQIQPPIGANAQVTALRSANVRFREPSRVVHANHGTLKSKLTLSRPVSWPGANSGQVARLPGDVGRAMQGHRDRRRSPPVAMSPLHASTPARAAIARRRRPVQDAPRPPRPHRPSARPGPTRSLTGADLLTGAGLRIDMQTQRVTALCTDFQHAELEVTCDSGMLAGGHHDLDHRRGRVARQDAIDSATSTMAPRIRAEGVITTMRCGIY